MTKCPRPAAAGAPKCAKGNAGAEAPARVLVAQMHRIHYYLGEEGLEQLPCLSPDQHTCTLWTTRSAKRRAKPGALEPAEAAAGCASSARLRAAARSSVFRFERCL